MNCYDLILDEDGNLHQVPVVKFSLARLKQAIKNNGDVDEAISSHLVYDNPYRIIAQKWYTQHSFVQTLDPSAAKTISREFDNEGNETATTLPNAYDIALAARTALEAEYPWLGNYRGVVGAPERPEYVIDIQTWKDANNIDREQFKTDRADKISKLTVTVDDMVFDADDQSVIGMGTRIQSMSDTDAKKWALANNTVAEVTKAQFLEAMRLGSDQITAHWFSPT